MKPNKKEEISQPVDSRLNKPSEQIVKKSETKTEQSKTIQDNQYGAKQKNAQQQDSTSPNSKKIAGASGASKEEMETATVEKDRSKKGSDSASKINTSKGNR